jgi:hypothetical protein
MFYASHADLCITPTLRVIQSAQFTIMADKYWLHIGALLEKHQNVAGDITGKRYSIVVPGVLRDGRFHQLIQQHGGE